MKASIREKSQKDHKDSDASVDIPHHVNAENVLRISDGLAVCEVYVEKRIDVFYQNRKKSVMRSSLSMRGHQLERLSLKRNVI